MGNFFRVNEKSMERKSLFGAQSRSWTPLENEFLAENELIEVIPNFSCPKREFIQGSYGPFHPNRVIEVPLWLAATLKKSKKCRIKLPKWMGEAELKGILEREKADEGFYGGLPFYYREISKVLFDIDKESNHKQVRVLIQDIEDVRESKTKKGLKQLESSTYIVRLNNISSNQLNKNVRINVCSLLNYFYDITRVGPNADANATQNNASQSQLDSTQYSQSQAQSQSQYASQSQAHQDQDMADDSQPRKANGQPMRKLRRLR